MAGNRGGSNNNNKNGAASRPNRTIVWFRNDQRLLDNPILHEAVKLRAPEVICVYCFDPRHYETTPYGSPKTAAFRSKFLVESIAELRTNLQSINSDLLVSLANPEDLIPTLCVPNTVVLVQHEDAWEELQVQNSVAENIQAKGGTMKLVHGSATLYHPDDVPFESSLDIPDGFTPFKKKVEDRTEIRKLLPTPKKGQLPNVAPDKLAPATNSTCSFEFMPTEGQLGLAKGAWDVAGRAFVQTGGVLEFLGGESRGKKRLQEWMFDNDNLKDYFNIRNGMLGEGYSSKFSPWLANGNISPRWIYQECKRYERERGISNKSTYWLVFELIWRDFFHYLLPKYGRQTFFSGGMKNVQNKRWSRNEERIRRWKTGTTGVPLVDANMRELATTGWMSNRGRQNVASYLVLDMGVDWRIGADHFESLLLDHDVYSNYGNWNSAAGLTGGRVNRFNITKQSKDYDPKGDYIRHWIPELAKVPAPLIFEPWKMSMQQQEKYGVSIGTTYNKPLRLEEPSASSSQRGNNNNNGRNNNNRNAGGSRNRGGGGRGGGGGGGNGRGGGGYQKKNYRVTNRNGNDSKRSRNESNNNQNSRSDVPDWFMKTNPHAQGV